MTYLVRELRERGIGEDALSVRAWRRRERVTQQQLAMAAGVAKDTLARFEIGDQQASQSTLEKLRVAMLAIASDQTRRRAWVRVTETPR